MWHCLWNWETGIARNEGLRFWIEGVPIETPGNRVLTLRISGIRSAWQLAKRVRDRVWRSRRHRYSLLVRSWIHGLLLLPLLWCYWGRLDRRTIGSNRGAMWLKSGLAWLGILLSGVSGKVAPEVRIVVIYLGDIVIHLHVSIVTRGWIVLLGGTIELRRH